MMHIPDFPWEIRQWEIENGPDSFSPSGVGRTCVANLPPPQFSPLTEGANGLKVILFWLSCVPVSPSLHRGSQPVPRPSPPLLGPVIAVSIAPHEK